MAHENTLLTPGKTYATADNARAAADKVSEGIEGQYYIAFTEEGRAYPIFLGRGPFDAGLYRKGFICIMS